MNLSSRRIMLETKTIIEHNEFENYFIKRSSLEQLDAWDDSNISALRYQHTGATVQSKMSIWDKQKNWADFFLSFFAILIQNLWNKKPKNGSLVSPKPLEGNCPTEFRAKDVCSRGWCNQNFKVSFILIFFTFDT